MALSDQMPAAGQLELLKAAALAGEWTLDPARTTVSLKNKSIWGLVPVNGVFREVTGMGTVAPSGQVTGVFTVAAASVDTKNTRRDNHLRSAYFFEASDYPNITFSLAEIRQSDQGVTLTGTLSVRGRTRPLSFEGAAGIGEDGDAWLDAAVIINQADFGLTWNFMGMVSMKTTITVNAVFTRR